MEPFKSRASPAGHRREVREMGSVRRTSHPLKVEGSPRKVTCKQPLGADSDCQSTTSKEIETSALQMPVTSRVFLPEPPDENASQPTPSFSLVGTLSQAKLLSSRTGKSKIEFCCVLLSSFYFYY